MAGEVDRLKGYVHTVVMGPPLPEAMLEQRRRDGIPIMMVDEERVWCGGFFLRVSELAALEATRLEMIEALDKQEADALAEKSIASLAAEVKAGMEPAEVSSMDDVPAENSDLGELDQAEEILSPLLLETSLAAHATKRAGENIKFEGESLRVGCPVDEYVEEYSVNEYRRSVETESPPRAAGCVGGKVEEAFAVYSGGATVADVLEGRVRLERDVDRQGIGLSGGTSVGNDVGMLGSLPEKDADNPSPNLGGSVPVGVDRGTDSMWDHVIMMFVPADALTREPSLVGDGWVSSWSERGLDVTRDKMTVGDLLESFPAVRTLPDGLSFDMAWADGLVVYPHDPDPGELRTSLRSLREEAAAHGFYGDGVGLVMLSGRTCRWLLRHDAESMRLAYTTHAGEEITAEFTSSMTVVRQNGVLTGKLARNSGQLFETFLAECRKRKEKGENFRLPWWLSGDTSVSK